MGASTPQPIAVSARHGAAAGDGREFLSAFTAGRTLDLLKVAAVFPVFT